MGEIADGMINGECCSECGAPFNGEHGYPVLCADCHRANGPASELPLATIEEL